MKGVSIRWHCDPFLCEFRREDAGASLYVFSGSELMAREAVASVTAAYERAADLRMKLLQRDVRRAEAAG